MRPTKELKAFFALAESLPTSATLWLTCAIIYSSHLCWCLKWTVGPFRVICITYHKNCVSAEWKSGPPCNSGYAVCMLFNVHRCKHRYETFGHLVLYPTSFLTIHPYPTMVLTTITFVFCKIFISCSCIFSFNVIVFKLLTLILILI